MIRADLDLLADRTSRPWGARSCAAPRRARERSRARRKPRNGRPFPPPAPVPAWARASGRAGEGDPLFAAGAGLALLDAFLRRDPPAAGALRSRLALHERRGLRQDPAPQRRRSARCATCASPSATPLGPAANLCSLWRDLAGRPPSLDPGRIADAAARLDLALPDPNGLAASLKACAGEGDPVSRGRKAAALAFSAFPDAPAAEAEILALWVFDLVTRHPAALAAARAADRDENSGSRPCGRPSGGRRPRPGDPAWPNAAAGAIALAAASALDLAADLSRRSETLIAVAPKLRAETGGQNRRPAAWPTIASRPPRRRARRR